MLQCLPDTLLLNAARSYLVDLHNYSHVLCGNSALTVYTVYIHCIYNCAATSSIRYEPQNAISWTQSQMDAMIGGHQAAYREHL